MFQPGFKKTFLKEIDSVRESIDLRNGIVARDGHTAETVKLSANIRVQISDMRSRLREYTKNPDFQKLGNRLLDDLWTLEKDTGGY